MLRRNKSAGEPQNMAIGEFGGAPPVGAPVSSNGLYWLYEMSHAALNPARAFADVTKLYFKNPLNPLAHTTYGKTVAAAAEMFERSTRRYGKPEWGIDSTMVGGERAPVHETVVWERPFCRLIHFERMFCQVPRRPQPKMLIVAPMSGHYATLLRGTVEAFLPNHEVYITDWVDARMVAAAEGRFDLDDYIDYIISMLHKLGGDTHVIAVCQPSVPVMAATAIMEAGNDPYAPRSMTLMGGPIDTRIKPTAVNKVAQERGTEWFRRNVISKVPFPHPGVGRDVYPGFLQLNGFMSMNLDRHLDAHQDLFINLVKGDGDSASKHKEFYDEYLAVMDLAAEYYLRIRPPRAAGRSRQDHRHRAAHRRGRERRHLRRRPDRGGAQAVSKHSAGAQGALSPTRRRPLRRVQWLALPRRGRPAHLGLHPDQQRRAQAGGCCQAASRADEGRRLDRL